MPYSPNVTLRAALGRAGAVRVVLLAVLDPARDQHVSALRSGGLGGRSRGRPAAVGLGAPRPRPAAAARRAAAAALAADGRRGDGGRGRRHRGPARLPARAAGGALRPRRSARLS